MSYFLAIYGWFCNLSRLRKIQLVKAHSFCDWQKEETADEIRMTKQQSCNGNLKN